MLHWTSSSSRQSIDGEDLLPWKSFYNFTKAKTTSPRQCPLSRNLLLQLLGVGPYFHFLFHERITLKKALSYEIFCRIGMLHRTSSSNRQRIEAEDLLPCKSFCENLRKQKLHRHVSFCFGESAARTLGSWVIHPFLISQKNQAKKSLVMWNFFAKLMCCTKHRSSADSKSTEKSCFCENSFAQTEPKNED